MAKTIHMANQGGTLCGKTGEASLLAANVTCHACRKELHYLPLAKSSKQVVASIVGRLHVGATDDQVRAAVAEKVKAAAPAPFLKACQSYGLQVHLKNILAYRRVMSGGRA